LVIGDYLLPIAFYLFLLARSLVVLGMRWLFVDHYSVFRPEREATRAVLTALNLFHYRLGVGKFGVLLWCTFNGTITDSNFSTLYA